MVPWEVGFKDRIRKVLPCGSDEGREIGSGVEGAKDPEPISDCVREETNEDVNHLRIVLQLTALGETKEPVAKSSHGVARNGG